MLASEAAAMIDISAVRTNHTLKDLEEMVEYAKKYRFINVHVLPCWVKTLAGMLKDVEGVYVGSPVGFPGGAHTTKVKLEEAERLINDGVQEMDIMMNIGKLKNAEFAYVEDELRTIVDQVRGRVLVKVIIEINLLDDREMLKACDLVMKSGADFVKTGTGWINGNANIKRVAMIKEHCKSHIKVKAAGGIRTRGEFLQLAGLGVERMGINTQSAIQIVRSFEQDIAQETERRARLV